VESVTSALFAEPHFTISSLLTVLRPRWRRFRKGLVGMPAYYHWTRRLKLGCSTER
jgi:hypothetical protein